MKRFLLILFLSTMTAPLVAWGGEAPRTINFTVVLQGDDGGPACDQFYATKSDPQGCNHRLTLGDAAAHALSAMLGDQDRQMAADVKFAYGLLGNRVKDAKAAVLTSGEISVIKERIAKLYSPGIVAQAFPLLDPASKPADLK